MKKILFALLCTGLFPVMVSAAEVFPSFPMAFWGTVKVDSQAAPTGTIVRAYAGNDLVGEVTTLESGTYGYTDSTRQKLLVRSGGGTIQFSFQHTSLNGGVETRGTVVQSGGTFASGETVNKDLVFSLVTQTSPTPPSPPSGGGGGGGGGGGAPSVPTNPFVSILNGALTTPTTSVYLNLSASGASQMLIANEPFFLNSSWVSYAMTYPWKLSSSDTSTTKVVYVKYRSSSGGDSATVSDSIVLSATSTTTVVVTPVTTTTTATGTKAVLGEKLTRIDELIAKLKPYKTAKEVPELQKELQKLGYFSKNLKFTTYYGSVTVSGVKKYTDAKKKQALYALIDSLITQVKFGDKNTTVKQLQQQLQIAGFYSKKVKITSKFDKYTQDSVKRFEASKKKK